MVPLVHMTSNQRHKGRFLIEATLTQSTMNKYKGALRQFLQWCDDNNYDATTMEQLDDLLTDYFHDLYEQNDGTGKGLAACTFYGLCKYLPRCSDKLPSSHMSLKGWMKLQPGESYPPLTYDLAVLIACHMTMNGHFRYGVGVLLAFDCLLRVGELCNIRRCDVADVGDPRMGKEYAGTSLRLPKTKTGANQWVTVEHPAVVTLIRLLLSVTSGAALLFPFSSADFRSVFKATCSSLGLSSKYVPHSLRHGGATRLHLLGRPIEDILLRGRWSSNKSARRYIQAGRAMLLTVAVSSQTAARAKVLSSHVLYSLYLSLSQHH
jgi:Phage integrase family